MRKKFSKELPGADCVFKPDDILDYENDAWDIRISLSNAPLEEAFYYTMDDPSTADMSINQLLKNHALDPEKVGQLDIAEYPDLPAIQTELNLYLENARKNLLKVDFFINQAPESEPLDLNSKARDYLGVCTYHDGSHDYRVLDLILIASPPVLGTFELDDIRRKYGQIYLLLLFHQKEKLGEDSFTQFLKEPPFQDFKSNKYDSNYKNIISAIKSMEMKRIVKSSSSYGPDKNEPVIQITKEGHELIEQYKNAAREIAEVYDCYESCSIAPPALGIPGGFDVRVQMMELDGKNLSESILLRVLEDFGEEFFSGDWAQTFENMSFYNNVLDGLAFKTNFSFEVLQQLKELANK